MQQDQETLGFQRALGVFRRRAPLIVLFCVLVAAIAFLVSKHEAKKYTAASSLSFSVNPLSQEIAGLAATSSGSSLAQQANNVELVRHGDISAKTASLLGHGLTAEKVAGSLKIAGQGESSVVDISATTTSPELAAAIANTYAKQFVQEQQLANREYFRSALALVHKQLVALPPRQRLDPVGIELQDRAQTLNLLSELSYNNVQVAEGALTPSSPSSPKTKRNTALGAFLGLVLGLGLAFLLERLDRRVREPEDLETIYGLPLLGIIPKSTALARAGGHNRGHRAALPPAEAEAFSLIRAHLRFFAVDRDLRTVLIASASPDDGKTTIARHLAEAAARLGSRVLLLEVDLRHPTLAQQLNIEPGPGLADVLIGAVTINMATRSVDLEASSGQGAGGRTLHVLTAGATLPPNPGELTASNAMSAVLERARSDYDLVVIDTPPLGAVSDAFPLLDKVDGVVLVGRVGSRRDAADRLHHVLASSTAQLLGVISNASKSAIPASYGYTANGSSPLAPLSPNDTSPSEDFVPTAKA